MRRPILLLTTSACLLWPAAAAATVPGGNGQIVFWSTRNGNTDVYAMNPDGSDQTNLTNHPGADYHPEWSPDGGEIAFVSARSEGDGIYVMGADGLAPERIPGTGISDTYPSWSPDGMRIAFGRYENGEARIYVVDRDGANLTRLTAGSLDFTPKWSPDGTKIAFASFRTGDSGIYVMNPDGSALTNLSAHPGDSAPTWSPDGTRLAFSSRRDGDNEIYVMDADGSGQQRLTNDPGHDAEPAWSPDGTRIAFTTNRGGNQDIWAMNADGSGPVNLTPTSSVESDAQWQPIPDTDGDGLPDAWEVHGVRVGGALLDLPAMGADPMHKNIFVELDWMPGHKLKPAAIDIAVAAFAAAPVDNPDGSTGIDLHVDAGPGSEMDPVTGALWGGRSRAGSVAHQDVLGGASDASVWQAFDEIKEDSFGADRAPAFHYALAAHSFGSDPQSSGVARDIPSADFMITLGTACASECNGSTQQQAGTFMHELGHTLGLRHGGDSNVPYKPNYLSVMNYHFQFSGILLDATTSWFGYSLYAPATLPALDESDLREGSAFAPFTPGLEEYRTLTYCPGGTTERIWRIGAAAIDWNCNGTIDDDGVAVDVNDDGQTGTLTPFDDWAALAFDGGAIGDLGAPAPDHSEIPEASTEALVRSAQALTGDSAPPQVSIEPTGVGAAIVTATDDRGVSALAIEVDGTVRDLDGAGALTVTEPVVYTREVVAVAIDATGNASDPATLRADPAPPPATPPGRPAPAAPPAPAAGDTTAPRLSRLSADRRRIRFRLSEPAGVRLTIERRAAGRRATRRCVKPTLRLVRRGARRCTRYVRRARLTRAAPAGASTVAIARRLRPGRYRVRAIATDAAGNRSATLTARLRIRRR